MENASQALLIAGGVLVAIMILTMAVVLFKSASNVSSEFDSQLSIDEVATFNSKFSIYNRQAKQTSDGKWYDYITIPEIVSAFNLAYSVNEEFNNDLQIGVQVSLECDNTIDKIKDSGGTERSLNNFGISPAYQILDTSKNLKNKIYSIGSNPNKTKVSSGSTVSNTIDLNELLKNYMENDYNDGRVYKYFASGEIFYNDVTQMIDRIVFEIQKNTTY